LVQNGLMALKSSANESSNLPRPIASSFVKIKAELSVWHPIKEKRSLPAGT
jgi:hypothetical protein